MTIRVVDASAVVEYLFRASEQPALRGWLEAPDADLHVPSLCDLEVMAIVRRVLGERRSSLSLSRAREVLDDYVDLPLTRHEHLALLPRIFELRENFSAYDASYVVLAELLGGELITADGRLARAARRHLGLVTRTCAPEPRA